MFGDLGKMMKQAQALQSKMAEFQEEIANLAIEGAAGGGLVKVRASAKGRILGLSIDDSLIVPADKGMLEDLVVAAFNDARAKADEVAQQQMSKMASGLPLPPGFKLPF